MTELEAMKLLKDKQQAARRASAKLDRRRWDGCSACASKCCELCVYQNFGGDDWPCNVCRDGFTAYKPVNYCPVCGRPLTETAYSKFEEHIDGYYISIESYDKCVDTLKAKLYDMDKEIEELKAELERRINGGTT